jgi:flavin-dependent dehydrogenase
VIWTAHAEAYVTPVADDLIGVAILSSRREPYERQLAAFPDLADRIAAAEPASAVRGAGPLRQRARTQTAGRVLLAGDAAGYIDALTGEGLGVALASARELVACLLDEDPGGYPSSWRRVSRRSRAITTALVHARRCPGVPELLVPLAARMPVVFRAAVHQLAR